MATVESPSLVGFRPEHVKISLKGVNMEYPQRNAPPLEVVKGFTLDVYEGEFVCLIGESGCGKSTLLNAVAGLLPISRGQILIDGEEVCGPAISRGMVFQDDAVFPWYTVYQNVGFGLKLAKVQRAECDQRIALCLQLVGLLEHKAKLPRELSGGMRKRVDVARALVMNPALLLMDEPFASLDVLTKERLQYEFLKIWQSRRMTVLFVTHDLEEALFLGDRVVVMGKRPGAVRENRKVPFVRPRDPQLRTSSEFQLLRRELAEYLGPSKDFQRQGDYA